MDDHKQYEIALSLVDKVGAITARHLISYCGSAKNVFHSPRAKLLKVPLVGQQIADFILQKSTLQKAEEILTKATREGVKILSYADPGYPQRLKNIHNAPVVIYYKGKANLNQNKSVAIVGTRNATTYGKSFTEELISQLVKHQALIVSGLAYGIDITAHRASLKCELPTIGVMASGMDIIYPAVHRKTALQMQDVGGGLLTESTFGVKPDASRFPARNRIIAGLADAVVVVEAKEKGGALITAEIANNYHRDVFALPGSIYSDTSRGCNNLIKRHKAHLLTGVEDLEYIMNWDQVDATAKQASFDWEALGLVEPEKEILALLKEQANQEMFLDEISYHLKTSVSQVHAYLLNLELLGLVSALPGKKFILS